MLGLAEAARCWRPNSGSFGTAAFWWVRAMLWRYASRHSRAVARGHQDGRWGEVDESLDLQPQGFEDGPTRLEQLASEAPVREDELTAVELLPRVRQHLSRRLQQRSPHMGEDGAHHLAEAFLRGQVLGELGAQSAAADALHLKRQAFHERMKHHRPTLERAFSELVDGIRSEAA